MSLEAEALAKVIRALDELSIPYMVTGSVASSHHGRPRATHDVDVVIDPELSALDRLTQRLVTEGFYVDDERARHALRRRSQFNAIEMKSAVKIDLIVRKDRPFSREELRRRRRADLFGVVAAQLATPEDSILSKLEWSRAAGGSERQLADAAGVVEVQGDRLDREYVERWAEELGVLDIWERVRGGY